jgi:hypothetical protein
LNCATDVTVPACSTQAQVNAAWSAFLASTTASGGCGGVLTNNATTAPSACGGFKDVTWTYNVTNPCGQSNNCRGQFKTFTIGGYGTACNGNNPGCYRDNNFAGAFPNGLVIGCGSNKLTFTSSSAIQNYLPAGGPASLITSSATNPTTSRGVLSSQLIALTLSVGFDAHDSNFSSSSTSLGSLTIKNGTFAGMTVSNFLQLANDIIGGCSSQYSLSEINSVATAINENFDNGTVDLQFLNCGGQTTSTSSTYTCTKRFTVAAPAPVVFNCANNVTVPACSTQAQINAAWTAFLASTTASGGCGGVLTNNATTPPPACGGFRDVTWTYTVSNACGTYPQGCDSNGRVTCTKRFTVASAPPVTFNCANNVCVPACSTQAQINAAYSAFLASATASGGCGGVLTNNAPAQAPSACTGGFVDVTWTYRVTNCGTSTSNCGSGITNNNGVYTCTRRFTVPATPAVVFNCGNNVTVPACSTVAQVRAAWDAFLCSTTARGGCNGVLTRTPATMPSACGGFVDVTWTYTVSGCGTSQSCTRRFTVLAAPPVVMNCGNNVTIPACSTQAQVNAAYAAFLASTTASGGCNGVLTNNCPTPPSACGGFRDVTWTYTVSNTCGTLPAGCNSNGQITCTRRFTVASPAPVSISCANNVTVPACSTQAQINAAWTSFLASASASGGCGGVLTNNATTPPPACGGFRDVTWTYSVSNACGVPTGCNSNGQITCTRRFTVASSPAVVFNVGSDRTVPACSTQAQINAAWTSFLCSTTASGGCNGVLTNNATTPPPACGGFRDVTWTYTAVSCGQTITRTCTKRFTVASSSPIVFNCGSNVTIPSCKTQTEVNAAYAAFLCSTTASGGCNGVLTNNAPAQAPSACGGFVDVTWTYTALSCGQTQTQTCTRRFTVSSGGAVDVAGPGSVSYVNTSFNSQYAVNCAFSNWLAQFRTISSGCGACAVFSGDCRVAPSWTNGGTVRVCYSITGRCNSDSVCATFTITRASATCKVEAPKDKEVMTAKAYPNPFIENFNLEFATTSVEKVGVSVYDMTGKLIEQREINADEVSGLQIGERCASGVYNVIVTQGTEVKTLRVIKR